MLFFVCYVRMFEISRSSRKIEISINRIKSFCVYLKQIKGKISVIFKF